MMSTTTFGIDEFEDLIDSDHHRKCSDQIVDALGGVDEILREYIRITKEYAAEESILNTQRMQKISDIIAASKLDHEQTVTIWDKIYAQAHLKNDVFYLSRSDTFWHHLLEDSISADNLIRLLFSKIVVTIVTILFTALALTAALRGNEHSDLFFAMQTLTITLVSLYFVMLILSCNVHVFKLVFLSFDLWVKLWYVISHGVCNAIYCRRLLALEQDYIYPNDVIFLDCASVFLTITVAMVALIEGYGTSWKLSFCVSFALAMCFSLNAVYMTLLRSEPESDFELFPGVSFELTSYMYSSFRVLSIFLWKQALMVMYAKGELCICIYLAPQIKWMDDKLLPGSIETSLAEEIQRPESTNQR